MARTALTTSDERPTSSTTRAAHTIGIGHFSENRIQKRKFENEKSFPTDDAIQSILLGHPNSADGPRPRSKLSPVRLERTVKFHDKSGHVELLNTPLPPPTATLNLVNTPLHTSTSSHKQQTTLNTAIFGSSQLDGCPGDFCNFDMNFLENKDLLMSGGSSANGNDDFLRNDLSDFRRRLLLGSVSGEEESEDHNSLHALGAFKENPPSQQHHHHRGTGTSTTTSGTSAMSKKIPYRIIIQTRQEMPLVNRLLRRIRRGDDGRSASLSSQQRKQLNLYVTEDNYNDLAISSKLPSHYYQDVNCCEICFKIYKIITDSRSLAIKMIEKKKDKRRLGAAATQQQQQQQVSSHDEMNLRQSVDLTSTSIDSFRTQVFSPIPRTRNGGSGGSDRGYGDSGIGNGNDSGSRQMARTKEEDHHEDENNLQKNNSLRAALQAIESLTKIDIAEIKTMSKPPAAVEVVMEAVLLTLTGKTFTFQECRRLLTGGESFLLMLREFQLEDLTETRLRLIEPYVDNAVFRPENVQPVSSCAAKFCAWVLGVVQAARWQRGVGHKRSDYLQVVQPSTATTTAVTMNRRQKRTTTVTSAATNDDLTFVQKLERKKAKKQQSDRLTSAGAGVGAGVNAGGISRSSARMKSSSTTRVKGLEVVSHVDGIGSATTLFTEFSRSLDDHPHPWSHLNTNLTKPSISSQTKIKDKETLRREQVALLASQKKTSERLASQNKSEGNLSSSGIAKSFRCFDGITKLSYIVLGSVSLDITRCNFIVIHDFFDTCDATAITFKPIVQRHVGCQVLCFNSPGQANTVWSRPSQVERQHGAKEQLINNEWVADRLHELLQHTEEEGDLLLTNPFHLVGIGNGASIAAAFALKYGNDPLYANSLRSLVSINGFLYPDPQLAAILHSASQVFETTPHNRPDIPVSYWSRFVFSEEYLSRINPNLALNIYTAVSNPITNDGRAKITRGCLKHKDLRGFLHPDQLPHPRGHHHHPLYSSQRPGRGEEEDASSSSDSDSEDSSWKPVHLPVIILQSTENMLVNASNVDTFLNGRQTKHLWSHQQNLLTSDLLMTANDTTAQWVGKLSNSVSDYAKFSRLGKQGLTMLLDSLDNPKGAFVMWTRAGHALYQENKTALLDLMDALAYPSSEYYGLTGRGGGKTKETPKYSHVIEVESPVSKTKNRAPKRKESSSDEGEREADGGDEVEEIEEDEVQGANDEEEGEAEQIEESFDHVAPEQYISRDNDEDEEEMVLFKIVTPRPISVNEPSPDRHEEVEEVEDEESKDDIPPPVDDNDLTVDVDSVPQEYVLEESKVSPMDSPVESLQQPVIEKAALPATEELISQVESSLSSSGKLSQPTTTTIQQEPTLMVQDLTPEVETTKISKSISKKTFPETSIKSGNLKTEPLVMQPAPSRPELPHKSAHVGESQTQPRSLTQSTPTISSTRPLPLPLPQEPNELQQSLDSKLLLYSEKTQQHNTHKHENELQRLERLSNEQEMRRKQYQAEDSHLLTQLEQELEIRRQEREKSERLRRLEIQEIEDQLLKSGLVTEYLPQHLHEPIRIRELPDMKYDTPIDLPKVLTEFTETSPMNILNQLINDEKNAKKRGIMSMEKYEEVKSQMVLAQISHDQKIRHMETKEQEQYYEDCIRYLQRIVRGYIGRNKAKQYLKNYILQKKIKYGIIKFQACVRGRQGRVYANKIKKYYLINLLKGDAVNILQRVIRGYLGRKYYKKLKRFYMIRKIQKIFRGYLGRLVARKEKERLNLLKKKNYSATKIQSIWKMKVAKEEFRSLRIHLLASVEIQRIYRGYLGRKIMSRRRQWETAEPGPERIKLGLKLIEESKLAFERQQEEIDALHRSQERAEARVSHIHSELKESEKELIILERELQEIDQIEKDLSILTHERDILTKNIQDAAGMPRTAQRGHEKTVMGKEPEPGEGGHGDQNNNNGDEIRRKKAEAYALELTIQIKRAEREKKRQELETEFASVFQEVEKKRKALERLEASLADMESTRERKDREFRRLQKNLMQLLMEQKQELDDLRERGIELETATATTAAAAVATAKKAKEHEKHSTAMFMQTEELMKFQFMSMSLSYFSSLNMLKQLRDMNSDTTAAAVASSADAAAAAAAAATAANLPNMKKLHLGADDFVSLNIQKKKSELAVRLLSLSLSHLSVTLVSS
jgi:pimeloyl-ACP methyl ester carboxylesterase